MKSFRVVLQICLLFLVVSACAPVYAADCGKALFGWDLSDGRHVPGVLANEGVRGKDRGWQNFSNDSGNFTVRHGKRVNCGGTAFGKTCRDNPGVNMKTLTREEAVELYRASEWKWIRGEENASQYDAYLIMDMATNLGKEETCILLRQFKNKFNGHLADERVHGGPLTQDFMEWLNGFTKSDLMPPDHLARYAGDYYPGELDPLRRRLFVDEMVILGEKRYTTISKSPKRRAWLWAWSIRILANAR